MNRSKKMITLFTVFLIACTATFALKQYEAKQEEIQNSDAVILEFPTDSVRRLSWETQQDSFSFHQEDNIWYYDDENFPVSEDRLSDILSHFEAFDAHFIIQNVEDYTQYGLDKPACTICLETDEQCYTIHLGTYSKIDSQRYIDIGDGNVYLVSDDPLGFLISELSDIIEHDTIPNLENVEKITFTGEENYTIVKMENRQHMRLRWKQEKPISLR